MEYTAFIAEGLITAMALALIICTLIAFVRAIRTVRGILNNTSSKTLSDRSKAAHVRLQNGKRHS